MTGPLLRTVISTRWHLADWRGFFSCMSSTSRRMTRESRRSEGASFSDTCCRKWSGTSTLRPLTTMSTSTPHEGDGAGAAVRDGAAALLLLPSCVTPAGTSRGAWQDGRLRVRSERQTGVPSRACHAPLTGAAPLRGRHDGAAAHRAPPSRSARAASTSVAPVVTTSSTTTTGSPSSGRRTRSAPARLAARSPAPRPCLVGDRAGRHEQRRGPSAGGRGGRPGQPQRVVVPARPHRRRGRTAPGRARRPGRAARRRRRPAGPRAGAASASRPRSLCASSAPAQRPAVRAGGPGPGQAGRARRGHGRRGPRPASRARQSSHSRAAGRRTPAQACGRTRSRRSRSSRTRPASARRHARARRGSARLWTGRSPGDGLSAGSRAAARRAAAPRSPARRRRCRSWTRSSSRTSTSSGWSPYAASATGSPWATPSTAVEVEVVPSTDTSSSGSSGASSSSTSTDSVVPVRQATSSTPGGEPAQRDDAQPSALGHEPADVQLAPADEGDPHAVARHAQQRLGAERRQAVDPTSSGSCSAVGAQQQQAGRRDRAQHEEPAVAAAPARRAQRRRSTAPRRAGRRAGR